MTDFIQDLLRGLRMLVRNPRFTVLCAVTLALGIGATSIVLSLAHSVFLHPLPFKEADHLVVLWETDSNQAGLRRQVSPGNYLDWREQAGSFSDIAAFYSSSSTNFNISGGGEPERLRVAGVSTNFFQLLGVSAIRGRTFLPSDDPTDIVNVFSRTIRGGLEALSEHVVLLSHGLWRHRFGGDPNIIGKTLMLNGESRTVIGVLPPDFEFPLLAQLWIPLELNAEIVRSRNNPFLQVVARLDPNVGLRQAQAEMDTIARRSECEHPRTNAGVGVQVDLLGESHFREIRPALYVLLGAVSFLLLISCTNVANLLVVRSVTREKEMAIRSALGASRARLLSQLLAESVLLAAIGGSFGVLLGSWSLKTLLLLGPSNLSRLANVGVNVQLFGFGLAISLFTVFLFGLQPALRGSAPDVNESLNERRHKATLRADRLNVLRLLVISEVSMVTLLLIASGLLINSFYRLVNVSPGFNTHNVLALSVSLRPPNYRLPSQLRGFYREVLQRIGSLPGVLAAGATTDLPFASDHNVEELVDIGARIPPRLGQKPHALIRMVSPTYFRAMGIPLLRGRLFTEGDGTSATRLAIVNQTFARYFGPDQNPIGRQIRVAPPNGPLFEVIGVVGDVKSFGLSAGPSPEVYGLYLQEPWLDMTLVVRTASEPRTLASAVRSQVLAVDKDQPIYDVMMMEQMVSDSLAPRRFALLLVSVFTISGLILAAVGIYGVTASVVSQRQHEIAIRMAIGASRCDVIQMVLKEYIVLAAVGVVIGLLGALALTRMMTSLLYQVSTSDPATFAAAAAVSIGVTFLASYIPANNAAKTELGSMLRYS
jgi:putative ABC transport system permease protein